MELTLEVDGIKLGDIVALEGKTTYVKGRELCRGNFHAKEKFKVLAIGNRWITLESKQGKKIQVVSTTNVTVVKSNIKEASNGKD